MRQTEWVVVFMLVVVCVYALQQGSNWQKARHQEGQQEQMDEFKNAVDLFSSEWTYEEETPEKIKKERCRESKECYKLAESIVWEARGEPYDGQLAVASVILNRVDHRNFPDTIYGVITQPYQFSYLQDLAKQTPPRQSDWDKALLVAYDVKNGIVDRVTDSLFYLNKKAVRRMPRWAMVYEEVATIGNHTFYRYN